MDISVDQPISFVSIGWQFALPQLPLFCGSSLNIRGMSILLRNDIVQAFNLREFNCTRSETQPKQRAAVKSTRL
jgi:hypothetical protein